jgi:hypothetical protein
MMAKAAPSAATILPGRSTPSQRLTDAIIPLHMTRPLTSQERADILLWQWQLQRDLPPVERRLTDPMQAATASVVANELVSP